MQTQSEGQERLDSLDVGGIHGIDRLVNMLRTMSLETDQVRRLRVVCFGTKRRIHKHITELMEMTAMQEDQLWRKKC